MKIEEYAEICIRENRHIVAAGGGKYNVVSEHNPRKKFNDKPMSHKKALKLLAAIEIAKHKAVTSMARKSKKRSANSLVEVRSTTGIELREAPDGSNSPGILEGYAAVFNERSVDLGGFVEVIQPGAFSKSLARKDSDVRALREHSSSRILGRSTAKTATIAEDDRGLKVQIILPDNSLGRDTQVSVARRDITGMSFGFICREGGDRWEFQSLLFWNLVDHRIIALTRYAVKEIDSIL